MSSISCILRGARTGVAGRARLLRRGLLAALCATTFANVATPASAQEWPTRPVTIVVPFPAGGNTDTMARLAAEYLGKKTGVGFVVENRPAGGGIVAAAQIASGEADGGTLFFASAGQMVILPMLQPVKYDPDKDFTPVSIFGVGPFVLGVNASVPAKTMQELIAYAKGKKEKINVSSAGVGSIGHLTAALFAKRAGFDVVFVPYRGGGPAMNALVNGDVDMYFGNASELIAQQDGGKIRILAVSTKEPMAQLPNTPPVASIYPGFETSSWNGFLVAKDTPKAIVDKLRTLVMAAAKDPDIVKRLTALGIKPVGSTSEAFAETLKAEVAVYSEGIEAAGLKSTK